MCLSILLGEIAFAMQASPPIPTHFSVALSVCLSVVCHIRAPCLSRLTYSDARQLHLMAPITHCVTDPQVKGEIWG